MFPGIASGGVTVGAIASVFFDLGYFSEVGTGFSSAPTTLADHLGSWLIWLPWVVAILVVLVLFEMRDASKVQDKTTGSEPNYSKIRVWALCVMALSLVLGLTSLAFENYHVLLTAFLLFWPSVALLVIFRPAVRDHWPKWAWIGFFLIPPILAMFALSGVVRADLAMNKTCPTHVLFLESDDSASQMNVILLRSFELYLLTRSCSGSIRWVKAHNVQVIEKQGKVR